MLRFLQLIPVREVYLLMAVRSLVRHAAAPRSSHRVIELAQRVRLPPRRRYPPFTVLPG